MKVTEMKSYAEMGKKKSKNMPKKECMDDDDEE